MIALRTLTQPWTVLRILTPPWIVVVHRLILPVIAFSYVDMFHRWLKIERYCFLLGLDSHNYSIVSLIR